MPLPPIIQAENSGKRGHLSKGLIRNNLPLPIMETLTLNLYVLFFFSFPASSSQNPTLTAETILEINSPSQVLPVDSILVGNQANREVLKNRVMILAFFKAFNGSFPLGYSLDSRESRLSSVSYMKSLMVRNLPNALPLSLLILVHYTLKYWIASRCLPMS